MSKKKLNLKLNPRRWKKRPKTGRQPHFRLPSAATELNWNDTFLNSTDPFFDDLPTPEPTPELKMNFTMFTKPLTMGVELYMDKDHQVGKCLDEYYDVLHNTADWVENIRELTDEMINLQRLNDNTVVQYNL